MQFVLIDESTAAAPLKPQVTPDALDKMSAALTVYLNRDVASYWGGVHGVRVGSSTDVQASEIACAIVDALPNAPGAIAYHDVNGAEVPVVYLALETCDGVLTGATSVSSAMAHELVETVGDWSVNLWADDGLGSEWAHELADAVESWSYVIDGVTVSDFVLPAFFAPGAAGPYNYLATVGGQALTAPLQTAPGGYQIRRTSGGGETQVTGTIHAARLARKRHASSRTYRRGARV